MPGRYATELAVALELADLADAISLDRFLAVDLRVESKPDLTPVSDADLAVERAVRARLAQAYPADSVLGEEFGDSRPDARRRWIVDPIDGTKNFVRGVPIWATLIALVDDGEFVVGVVSAPALARRWWAQRGGGAFGSFREQPPRPLRVSAIAAVPDASLAYSDLPEWQAAGRGAGFGELLERCWRSRGYGDFYSYLLVAEGAADIAAEPELSLWDLAALVPIVTEAGGSFTGVDGRAADLTIASAVATNGLLHPEVLRTLCPDTDR
ncbi:histidinol-phosphatase [Nakamurella sp. A5-74]|uniref:Histidinol-phosphatase n=1 Tax=Nakamurella sp. A5-74 TaxID=3158264 RepID=A0AAU8DVK3_9ACTN